MLVLDVELLPPPGPCPAKALDDVVSEVGCVDAELRAVDAVADRKGVFLPETRIVVSAKAKVKGKVKEGKV